MFTSFCFQKIIPGLLDWDLKDSKATITDNVNSKHFERVFELMQRMQSFGNPPAEIVGEFGALQGGGAGRDVRQEEERFKAFLAQNGIDSESGLQFDATGQPILPEGFPRNDEQCLISWWRDLYFKD